MNKDILNIIRTILVFPAFFIIIGLILPKQRKAERIAEFNAAPEQIWKVVTDVASQATWRTSLTKVEMTGNIPNHETWIEYPQKGPAIYFKTVVKTAPSRFEFEMTDIKTWKGYWVGEFIPLPNHKTRLILTERSEIGNPFIRVLSYLFFDLGATMDHYLNELAAKLEEKYQKI
jgi:hypothetical protein